MMKARRTYGEPALELFGLGAADVVATSGDLYEYEDSGDVQVKEEFDI